MKKIIGMFTALSLLLVPVLSAQAADTTSTIGVNGGNLSLSNVPTSITFPPVTLDGMNWKWTPADVGTIRIIDGRGTGEGYNLTVSATQLTEVGGLGLTIPQGALYLYAPSSVVPVFDTDAPAPILATGGAAIDTTPFTVATAGVDTGLGTYDISFPAQALEINIPPSAKVVDKVNYPGSATPYETTITWTLNNTP